MLKKILMKIIGINEYTKPIKATYKENEGNIIHLENLQPTNKITPEELAQRIKEGRFAEMSLHHAGLEE